MNVPFVCEPPIKGTYNSTMLCWDTPVLFSSPSAPGAWAALALLTFQGWMLTQAKTAPLHITPPHKTHAKLFEATEQSPSAHPLSKDPIHSVPSAELSAVVLALVILFSTSVKLPSPLCFSFTYTIIPCAPLFSRDVDCPPLSPSDWPFRKGVPPNSPSTDLTRLPGCSGHLNI